ncbi:glycosyltransferase [Aliishimia ponticola]|uniref:Glycosyltransferase n=1 Tax=Aliishimia ponticola TaxID=2499833 RepID=A0A4S4NF30_9RHOB|nr:glycosyltransferase [Aliishimia ponticola]THH36731.1 glycosyltransferase [Aliishimia ponticola]
MERNVICMKWGTLYGPDYVNVLYNVVRENLSGDFRFICLTDDTTGIVPGVETFPIPDMGLSEFNWKKGGWAKLTVFQRELYDITGRCLFLDLDSIVTGPLDVLFEAPGDVLVIDSSENWRNPDANAEPKAMTSIFAFTAGQHPEVYDKFMADHDGMVAKYRIEQVYLQGEIDGGLAYWPREWVVSFKWHLRQPVLMGLVKHPNPPGPQCRVLAFHGEPRPIDLVHKGIWGIGPHWGRGRVPWAVDYWQRYGGDIG